MGIRNLERALATVEQRFVRHQARINRVLQMGGGGSTRGTRANTGAIVRESGALVRTQQKTIKLTEDQRKAVRAVGLEIRASQRYEMATHREKLRAVEREKRAEISKIRATRAAAIREQRAGRKEFMRSVGTGVSGGVSTLASVGRGGAAMIGVGGAALAASAVTETLRLDEQIRRFAVAGRAPGSVGIDPDAVRKQVMGISMARGIAPEAVMAGAQQFQTVTGRGDIGLGMADTFATFAQATGGDPAEIADAAASIFQNLKIEDINALTEALAKLTFQGKAGSFEFKDLAAQLPRVTAALAGRGIGGGGAGVAKMGAMLQVIQRGTGDAAVTSTAFDSVLRQMVAKAGDIQKGEAFSTRKKVNVFEGGDPTGKMRGDIDKLIADVLLASGGNAIELQKIFGDEGMKGMNMFNAEFKRAGGGEAGHAAVLKMFDEFVNVGGSYAEVQRDAADVQKSTSIQFQIAMMELKDVFTQELLPTVRELAPRVRELSPLFQSATRGLLAMGNALADNPIMGIGAILATAIGVEVAKAQLASLLQGGVITPLGAFGGALVVATGMVAAYSAYLEGKTQEGKQKARDAAARADEVRSKAKAELDATGTLTPETRKRLQEIQSTETKTLEEGRKLTGGATMKDASFWSSLVTGNVQGALANAGSGSGISLMSMLGVDSAEAELERRKALTGAATTKEYTEGASETKRLLAADELSQKYGPADFKAEAVGQAIGEAAAKKIQEVTALNRGNSPSPVKP